MKKIKKPKMFWDRLKSYKCPESGCGAFLKEVPSYNNPDIKVHECTTCGFKISDEGLSRIVTGKHKFLPISPPAFIEEMRNQEELNNL